ncbi:MAG: hypothetical protein ABSG01_15605 [Anaerolineales bacterium]|jgi:hypothetical protein
MYFLLNYFFLDMMRACPTVCVTGRWAGVDNAWERKKLEARKMLENSDESPLSSARCVSPHLIFMDKVHYLADTALPHG